MRHRAVVLSALLAISLVGGAVVPAAGQQADGEAYAGTHVEFRTTGTTVADYAVNGDVLVENVTVQSASEARSQSDIDVGASLESATDFRGAGLQLDSTARASASATIAVDSGAEMRAHDNNRGVLQVRATEGDQVVTADLGDGAEARAAGDGSKRVVVESSDGSQGTFIVVGDGEVVVDQNGDVTAEVEQDGQLVYRQYQDERSDSDEQAERMIQNGTATAEVYVQQAQSDGEDGAEEANETAVRTVQYGQDTTVEVTDRSRDRVEMTVERSQSQGKVVLATVSEAALENAQDVQVTVDGEAAAQADSYGAVEQSAQDGDQPRYYVQQSSSAEGQVDVAVGIDHFSARNVVLSSGETDQGTADGSDGTDDGGSGATDGDGAGFGALGALSALAAALLAVRRR